MTAGARRAWRALPFGALGLSALGTIVHLTVRDRVPVWATLFYATPPAVVAALCLVASAAFWLQRRRKWCIAGLCAAGPAVLWWGGTSIYWGQPSPAPEPPIKLMFWNAYRGKLGWRRVAARIPFSDLHVVVLAEAGRVTPAHERFWASRCPGMNVVPFGKHTWLMARGEVTPEEHGFTHWRERLFLARVRLSRATLTLVIVDLPSDPLGSRRPGFAALCGVLAQRRQGEPMMVVGDFNTPRDSVLFAAMRREFRHAFETAGRGLVHTWPVPVPVHCLDHAWVGPGIRLHRCEHRTTCVSDHRQVIVEFWLDQAQPDGAGPRSDACRAAK